MFVVAAVVTVAVMKNVKLEMKLIPYIVCELLRNDTNESDLPTFKKV